MIILIIYLKNELCLKIGIKTFLVVGVRGDSHK